MSQLDLALVPEPKPEVRVNPTAPKERKQALQQACWRALERLLAGPASADELRQVAGWRFGARLNELRPIVAWKAGRAPYLAVFRDDSDRNPIPLPEGTENPVYRLAPWAVDASRELLEARAGRG